MEITTNVIPRVCVMFFTCVHCLRYVVAVVWTGIERQVFQLWPYDRHTPDNEKQRNTSQLARNIFAHSMAKLFSKYNDNNTNKSISLK